MAGKKKVNIEPVLDTEEVVETPAKKATVKKAPAKEVDAKAEAKAKLLQEMVTDGEVKEIMFVRSRVPMSASTAEKLNKRPKKIAVWRAEEGEKSGTAEPVRINGAVAWIPKGVPVLVPDVVAESFTRYQRVEQTVGSDIPNARGGVGIRVDDDESLKDALNL